MVGSLSAASRPRASSRLLITTLAPASARAWPNAVPKCPVPPVTSAIFPLKSNSSWTVGLAMIHVPSIGDICYSAGGPGHSQSGALAGPRADGGRPAYVATKFLADHLSGENIRSRCHRSTFGRQFVGRIVGVASPAPSRVLFPRSQCDVARAHELRSECLEPSPAASGLRSRRHIASWLPQNILHATGSILHP